MNPYTYSLGLSPETVHQLQHLIQVNIDSHDSYVRAIDHVDDSHLKDAFRRTALERKRQAFALRKVLWCNFEETVDEGSLMAAAYRFWMDIRDAFGREPDAMLAEVMRIEDYVRDQYVAVISEVEGKAVRQLLHEQFEAVLVANDRIAALSDCAAQAATAK